MLTNTTTAPSDAHKLLMEEAHCLDIERDTLARALTANARTNNMTLTRILSLRLDDSLPHDTHSKVFEHLLRRASEVLGEAGIPLDIRSSDLDSVTDRFFAKDTVHRDPQTFSAVAVMTALLSKFEPLAGSMLMEQQAKTIYDDLVCRDRPRVVGGRTVLTRSAWLDSYPINGPRYSYDTQRSLTKVITYLAAVLPRLDSDYDPEDAEAARMACLHEFEANMWRVSREFRAHLGPIEIRVFQKKVEFWLPEAVANALNMFVSLHVSVKQAA